MISDAYILTTVAIGLGLLLLALELASAYIIYPLKTGQDYYTLTRMGSGDETGNIFVFHPTRGYSLRPNLRYSNPTEPISKAPRRVMMVDIRTDSDGLITDDIVSEIKEKKIFCVGGSTTMGSESHHHHTFPAEIDTLVKPRGYRCFNAGTGGYRSIHELVTLKTEILKHKPWGVIIFSGYNDFEDFAYGLAAPYDPFSHCLRFGIAGSRLENAFLKSAFFSVTKILYGKIVGKARRTEDASLDTKRAMEQSLNGGAWLQEWQTNVGDMIEECHKNGVKPYVLAHVSPVYKGAPDEAKLQADNELNMNGRFDIFAKYIDIINQESQRLCEELGATFIDIREDFEQAFLKNGKMDYSERYLDFVDRMHFTERGNKRIAELIYNKIEMDL